MEAKEIEKLLKDETLSPKMKANLEKRLEILKNNKTVKK